PRPLAVARPTLLRLDRRPSLLDPVSRSRALVVALSRLGPFGRRGDRPDRDRNDALRIPHREVVAGEVLAESRHRVLVALVIVRADVEVARGGIDTRTFEHGDDRIVVRPAADELVRLFHRLLVEVERGVRAVRLEARIFLPALVVAL